ncbi:hypothetical protein [Polaromonas sp. CG9_12]|nr:hypothetical protein [Polaromonas sp. CG9_12]
MGTLRLTSTEQLQTKSKPHQQHAIHRQEISAMCNTFV